MSIISAQEERTAKLGKKGLIRVAARSQNNHDNNLFSPKRESIFKRKIHDIIIDRCDSQENIPPNHNSKKELGKNKQDKDKPTSVVTLWRRKSGCEEGSVSSLAKGLREQSTNNNNNDHEIVLSARISVMSEMDMIPPSRSVISTTRHPSQRGFESHILVKKTANPSGILDSSSIMSMEPSKSRLSSKSVDHRDKLHSHQPVTNASRTTFDSVLDAMKKHGQLLGPGDSPLFSLNTSYYCTHYESID